MLFPVLLAGRSVIVSEFTDFMVFFFFFPSHVLKVGKSKNSDIFHHCQNPIEKQYSHCPLASYFTVRIDSVPSTITTVDDDSNYDDHDDDDDDDHHHHGSSRGVQPSLKANSRKTAVLLSVTL
jgi:hypothetical protein